ncbi:MAG: YggS family pyridoxal phosphate-dependent enzyme [Sphingobacteriales bacterium]|jgi:pyridoxal phosphate enzyme (YggS family)|nr:YggS family pyridoxal phosphate-dependent enzyme [Sphingobacteriales bacterium]
MPIHKEVLAQLDQQCEPYQAQWIAVTKMRSIDTLKELYNNGKKVFGENKAQELCDKYPLLPKDIDWHFIGHLQTNKVKQIIDKVSTIHAVDSLKLLNEIQKETSKVGKTINVFLQLHIAQEETKYGFSVEELMNFFKEINLSDYPNIRIQGLMAMASLTEDKEQIRSEFMQVKTTLDRLNKENNLHLNELSMGMSGDYEIALECGATWIRVGSLLYNE